MARERSPARKQAELIYLDSGGLIKLKDIASKLNLGETQIRKWKSQDKWDDTLNGNVTNQTKGNVTKKIGAPKGNKNALGNRGGAPPNNKNAVGNRGGNGGPYGNDKAVIHGLFRKFLPDDPETLEIFDASENISRLDMLWMMIRTKWTNIVRAQKIMFVKGKEDLTKELKREKESSGVQSDSWEKEYELQFAWDKHAAALTAQARAMSELRSMIKQYEEMLRQDGADEEQQMRVNKLKAEVKKINKDIEASSKGNGKEPLHIEIDYGDDEP